MVEDGRSGTLSGLLALLEEALTHPELNRTTVQAVRSSWHSVAAELGLSPATLLVDLDPDALIDEFEKRRAGFRSGATYRTRLRVGKALYQSRLDGDPNWASAARTRQTVLADSLNIMPTRHASLIDVVFPLRQDVWIKLEIPADLSPDEAERIASIYRGFVIPGDAHAGQKEAPAT